jgi:transporter family protein
MTRWLAWTLLTVVLWGIWAVLPKLIAHDLASPAHLQAASTLGIVPVIILLWMMKENPAGGRRQRGALLALGSGIVSCLATIAYFEVLSRGAKAASAISVTALYPAVTVLLAVPILKERLARSQIFGICLSLVAIYLFNVRDDTGVVSPWLNVALIAVALWGVCGLMQKMSTNHISARSSAFWFLLSFFPVAAFILARDSLPGGLPAKTWILAVLVGLTLALGNVTILMAFASGGKASIIAPLAGLYPLVSIAISVVVLGESITRREMFGIGCALVAVAMLSFQAEPERSRTPPGLDNTP